MSPYEIVMSLYVELVKAYGWTIEEIDKQDLESVFDMLNVMYKIETAPRLVNIEDVLPF